MFSFGMMMYEVMQRYLVIQSVAGTGSRHELERYAKQVSFKKLAQSGRTAAKQAPCNAQ